MVVLDLDHPDIEEFIDWKVIEEQKVAALVAGSIACEQAPQRRPRRPPPTTTVREDGASTRRRTSSCEGRDPRRARTPASRRTTSSARSQLARQGVNGIEFEEYDTDWDSKAYVTVSGQNRTTRCASPTTSCSAVEADGTWHLILAQHRTAKAATAKTEVASRPRDLWDQIAYAAWQLRRPRRAVRHHDQRVAHLPGRRPHQREQPLLRVHVPRRHGVQPGVANLLTFYDPSAGHFDVERFARRVPPLDAHRSRSAC